MALLSAPELRRFIMLESGNVLPTTQILGYRKPIETRGWWQWFVSDAAMQLVFEFYAVSDFSCPTSNPPINFTNTNKIL